MKEQQEHPMYKHLQRHARLPLFIIRHTYGRDASRTVLELWAAFGMNPKNEKGLINQIDERLPVALVDDVPTITYDRKGITLPLLVRAPRNSSGSYSQTYFVHIDGRAHQISIKQTRLVDCIVSGATRMHQVHGHPQEQNSTLLHLFEANQLVARKRNLIDW